MKRDFLDSVSNERPESPEPEILFSEFSEASRNRETKNSVAFVSFSVALPLWFFLFLYLSLP